MDIERSYSGTIVAALLLALMVAGVSYRYWPSDERSIRRHLSNLAEALSFPLSESDEERITRVEVLREYFAPDVRIHLDDRELTSRDEIIRLLSHFQPPPGGVNVEFVNIIVTLAADSDTAAVTLTAKLSSTNAQGVSTLDQRVADVTMRKIDDDWVIAAATLRATQASSTIGSTSFSTSLAIPTTLSSPSMSISFTPWVARPIARTSSV
jgi:SnoaL-like protein